MPYKPGLGVEVSRAAAVDPQNVWEAIFTISGLVKVTFIAGIRTVIQAGGASTMQLRHTVGNTVLCAAASIAADAVDTVYTITGTFADAIQIGAAGIPLKAGIRGGLLATGDNMQGLLLSAGDIEVTMTAAAGTGSTRYVVYYMPLDVAATIVAA